MLHLYIWGWPDNKVIWPQDIKYQVTHNTVRIVHIQTRLPLALATQQLRIKANLCHDLYRSVCSSPIFLNNIILANSNGLLLSFMSTYELWCNVSKSPLNTLGSIVEHLAGYLAKKTSQQSKYISHATPVWSGKMSYEYLIRWHSQKKASEPSIFFFGHTFDLASGWQCICACSMPHLLWT